MKFAGVLLIVAVLAAGAYFAYTWLHTPFDERYAQACMTFDDTGDAATALPVFEKAVTVYADTPAYAAALYRLAQCEAQLNDVTPARWEEVLRVNTAHMARCEARYHLALANSDRATAMELFVRDFPASDYARALLVELGDRGLADKDVMRTWEAWQTLVDHHYDSAEAQQVRDRLGALQMQLLCSPRPLPFTLHHQVAPGENLTLIARKYGTTTESLQRINRMSSDAIRPGTRLKVDQSRYILVVDVSDHEVTLARLTAEGQTNFVKAYAVGTGRDDNTPHGVFRITDRLKKPTWYKPGSEPMPYGSPDNLLGTRWLGIDCPGFGLHGTWEPETIGKASSAGCIRLLNEDVEEVYDLVPLGTPVLIHD
jgi:lipoprotein-anchoring transpeptidase ErfK/SrfK